MVEMNNIAMKTRRIFLCIVDLCLNNTNIEYATTETQKCVLLSVVVQLKHIALLTPPRLSFQPDTMSVQTCAVIPFGFG